jgi:hypothetical protein
MKSLDRQLLDRRGGVPDVKLLTRRLHHTGHALACHRSADVVLAVIDAHASIGLHRARKGSLVDPLQPAVRIDHVWDGRQGWERRAGHTRRLVATGTGLVGALVIVMRSKGLGDLEDLLARPRPIHEAPTPAKACDEIARRRDSCLDDAAG